MPAQNDGVPARVFRGTSPGSSRSATGSTQVSGRGSRIAVSYVPPELWDSPEKVGVPEEAAKKMLATVEKARQG